MQESIDFMLEILVISITISLYAGWGALGPQSHVYHASHAQYEWLKVSHTYFLIFWLCAPQEYRNISFCTLSINYLLSVSFMAVCNTR